MTTMYIPSAAVEIIKRWEGYEAEPYLDAVGIWTIGYGLVLRAPDGRMLNKKDPRPDKGPWTEEQATDALRDELCHYLAGVLRACPVPLTSNQVSALTSFSYNLGIRALRSSTLRRKVNAGDHAEVPEQFHRWVFAGGKKLRGLVRRRADEAALYALSGPQYFTRSV